jgi:hypothetical protein
MIQYLVGSDMLGISSPISYGESTGIRGGSRKKVPQNRKTAIGAFFCTGNIRMETGLIIENGLILPSKNRFKK